MPIRKTGSDALLSVVFQGRGVARRKVTAAFLIAQPIFGDGRSPMRRRNLIAPLKTPPRGPPRGFFFFPPPPWRDRWGIRQLTIPISQEDTGTGNPIGNSLNHGTGPWLENNRPAGRVTWAFDISSHRACCPSWEGSRLRSSRWWLEFFSVIGANTAPLRRSPPLHWADDWKAE